MLETPVPCQVIVQPPGDVQIRFLEHVRGVESSPEPPVEAQLDHPAEAVPVPLKQLREGLAIPRPGAPGPRTVEAARERVNEINPAVTLVPVREAIDSANGRELLQEARIVVDHCYGLKAWVWSPCSKPKP